MDDAGRIGMVHALPGQTVNLLAGQLCIGHDAGVLKTLLGSCVAVTLWHPTRRLGAMCHYLLPHRVRASDSALDGRFGDEAMEMLVVALRNAGAAPREFEAQLYGGADTMPDRLGVKFNIGERNIEQGWSLIERHGFELVGVDVGDHVPRHLQLMLSTGEVRMRRGAAAKCTA